MGSIIMVCRLVKSVPIITSIVILFPIAVIVVAVGRRNGTILDYMGIAGDADIQSKIHT